jgi:tRNA (guanine26-N2/guanine27-N2)-dimethyltransferase
MTVEKEYTEGTTTFRSADVEHYSEEKGQPTTSMPVFYNPRMRLNRDISVLMLSGHLASHTIDSMCEPLTGSGVRTLRYLNECEGDFSAKMFDANPLAVRIAQENLERLGFSSRGEVVTGDAKVLLLTESREKRFDFVDIDPFGSPAPYLNAAVQSMNPEGGLLAATATDMPVLCGVYPKVSLRKYGGVSIRAPFVHEIAARLLLGRAFTVAGSNDCAVSPLAVLSTDHYVRAWMLARADKRLSNRLSADLGMIRYCPKCMHYDRVPLGNTPDRFEHAAKCDGQHREAGPLWTGNLFDRRFLSAVSEALAQYEQPVLHRRVPDLLEKMKEEQELTEYPYIDLHSLCDLYNLSAPKNRDVVNGLREIGYRVTRTHFSPTSIRTDASPDIVADIVKSILKRK